MRAKLNSHRILITWKRCLQWNGPLAHFRHCRRWRDQAGKAGTASRAPGSLGTNFSEISVVTETCAFKTKHLKMSRKCRPFCLGLNVVRNFPSCHISNFLSNKTKTFHTEFINAKIVTIYYTSHHCNIHVIIGNNGSCTCRPGLCQDWPLWRHQIETFSALLVLCAGNSLVTGEFPTQRPVTRSFDVFVDLCANKRFSKQSLG